MRWEYSEIENLGSHRSVRHPVVERIEIKADRENRPARVTHTKSNQIRTVSCKSMDPAGKAE
jgi:hypothetical protein